MSANKWGEVLVVAQSDGSALSNTVTETSILPAAAKFTLGANLLDWVGKVLRVRAAGRISTVVTTPGNLTLAVRFGTIDVFTTGTMSLNVVAQTNQSWVFDVEMILRAIGTSANFMGIGTFASRAILGGNAVATSGDYINVQPDTAPAVGSNFDSTVAQVVDFMAIWSVANAANSILLHQYSLELRN